MGFGQYWTSLCLASSSVPSQPCIQFLFVSSRVCVRLPSDSTSPWTPLSFANSSYCQACSGLSPPSCCACWHTKNPSFMNLKEGFSYSIQLIFHTFCSTSALFSFLFRFIFFSPLTVPTNPFGKTSNTIMYNKPRIIVHRSKIGYSVASSDK